MPKPILIIKNPFNEQTIWEELKNETECFLDEYYVVIIPSQTSEIEFECLYEKDMNLVKWDELKDMIIKSNKK